jgi:hypothetical protein
MLRRILLSLTYVVLTILVVAGTFVLVAYGNDYSYDFSTHKIIQNGHIIIDSIPSGVAVQADGKDIKKKTPYQAVYKVGTHTFSLAENGFWTWQKTLSVSPGVVTLANYVVLVPRNPKVTVLDSRTQILDESMSKDLHHLAYITGGPDGAVYTLDLGNPTPVKIYSPQPATATTPAEVLTGVSWSADNSHLLISSLIGSTVTYRLASASGGTPVDLTTQYQFDFTGLTFSSSNWQQMYWISPDGLRRLDVSAQSVSAVLAPDVIQFWVVPGRVLYVQQSDGADELWSVDGSGHRQELIEALANSASYSVTYASFGGTDELAVVPVKTGTGTLYSGIYSSTPVAKVIARGVTAASFSPDGHLLAFSSPTSIVTYDLNQSTIFDRLVSYTITNQPGNLSYLSWFDNYHLLTNRSGSLYWSEYDGSNLIKLGPVDQSFSVYGTSDAKSITEFKPEPNGVQVAQLQIIK